MKCERKKGERKKVKGAPTPTSMVFAPPSVPPFPWGKKPKGGSLPLGRFIGGRQNFESVGIILPTALSYVSFSYNRNYQFSGTAVIAVLAEVDALPGAEIQTSVGDRNGDAYTAQRGLGVSWHIIGTL